jgi:hypothetical protein
MLSRSEPRLGPVESELPFEGAGLTAHRGFARVARSVGERAGRNGMLVLIVGLYAAALAALGRVVVSVDSWLALVVGRLIAAHGIPTHDTLTVFAHGRRWVDQQWLAQIAIYELERAGGLRLAVFIHVLLLVASLAAAIVLARSRGAGTRSVAVVTAIALLPILVSSLQLRTQSFVYPLFIALLAIAAARRPLTWTRLVVALGILCLWSNLHGSVVLGAGLLALRGASDLFDDFRARQRPRATALAATLLPWPCLLVTPFPREIPHYYATTVFNSKFGQYLGQWQPTSLSLASLPLFVLAFGFFWLLARPGSGFTRFEKLAGLVLVAFALLAVRNWVWLGLGAVALFPPALDRVSKRSARPVPKPLNQVCAVAGLLLALVAGAILANGRSWFTSAFPDPAARAVARLAAADPSERIFASARWGDWLLWKQPQLAGRIAYDARAELFTSRQFKTIALSRVTPALLPEISRRFRIFLVDKTDEPAVYATLRREGKVAYNDGDVLVVSLPPHSG